MRSKRSEREVLEMSLSQDTETRNCAKNSVLETTLVVVSTARGSGPPGFLWINSSVSLLLFSDE